MLKTVSSFANAIGALVYKGTWDAQTNTPTLQSSVGSKGDYYYVSVAGNTNLNGITDWQIGDLALFNGTIWQKIDNTDAVLSVNGQTGADVGDTPLLIYRDCRNVSPTSAMWRWSRVVLSPTWPQVWV